jgi:hypothetical protein
VPLSCDCYPGCWGDHSKDWPLVTLNPFTAEAASQLRGDVRHFVPYGSYVEVKEGIRVEPAHFAEFNRLRQAR